MLRKLLHPIPVIAFLVFFFLVGIAGMVIPATGSFFTKLTPLSLLLSMALLLVFHQGWDRKVVLYMITVYLLGFGVEAVGVATGAIFGDYLYGSVLGLKIAGTPLMIGINWIMLVYVIWSMIGRTTWPPVLKILVSSLLMVVFDLFLEPVAMDRDMWSWAGDRVPVKNYLAWFVISSIFFTMAAIFRIHLRNRIAMALWFILLGFFMALNLFKLMEWGY
jgi:putative membrane protein